MRIIRYILMFTVVAIVFFVGCDKKKTDIDVTSSTVTITTAATATTSLQTVKTTTETIETTTAIDHSSENDLLRTLLPNRTGFSWKYNGFAEYGHLMTLDDIDQNDFKTVYLISGVVDDMSDGEAGGDFSLEITYEISKGELKQYTTSSKLMDSTYKEIVLIKPPFDKGAVWSSIAITGESVEVELQCEITDVKNDGIKTYVIRYDQKDSDYYEIREIKEGFGIVSFNRLFVSDDNNFDIGYTIYELISGYPEEKALKSILPPFNTELRYFGLAEYAHRAKWTDTYHFPNKSIYEINGSFEDGSGIPGDFTVQYILDKNNYSITEVVTKNTRSGETKINSIVSDMIILKTPLSPGNSWQQEVELEGKKYILNSIITGANIDPDNHYLVTYSVEYTIDGISGYFNDKYIQRRSFKTGRGMIGFSQLFPGDIGISGKDLDNKYLVEQALINHMFGYALDQNPF